MDEVKIPYKPKLLIILLSIVATAGLSVGMGFIARTNDQGLIINGIIELSVFGATLFYWFLAAGCAVLSVLSILAVIIGLNSSKEIVVSEHGIRAPKSGISKKIVTVNFKDISETKIQSVHKQHFLYIHHPGGRLTIAQSMLPDKQSFEKLTEIVANSTSRQ